LLSIEEQFTLAIVILIDLLILVFHQFQQASDIFLLNILIVVTIFMIRFIQSRSHHAWLQFLRDWYVLPLLIIIYLENRRLIPLINHNDLDDLMITIDRFLFFGHDPTVLLEKVTFPALSELLQIFYASFYFLPVTLCLLLYVRRSRLEFHISASIILLGFYISYIGYYITPVVGPRYTLDLLQNIALTGLFLFDFIRDMIAHIEGIMRDCCPSGHALISVLSVLLAYRYARGFLPAACVWAFLILFSTVYLRYHYVTDIIIGVILGLLVYWWGKVLVEAIILKDEIIGHPPGIISNNEETKISS
jgi:membrane-associated phospholipid phosphatase